jgi:universal stress protein A
MKVRSSRHTGGVMMELGREEEAIPAASAPPVHLKRILVPVDFSDCSHKALQYAAAFAKQFGAEIILVHIVELATYAQGPMIAMTAVADTSIREEAAKRLSEWRNAIASTATVKANVRTGTPYHEIVRAAEETNTDLIVIGTHGRGDFAHIFIGSTAERVVRHAPCPVFVVREREHDFVSEAEAIEVKSESTEKRRFANREKSSPTSTARVSARLRSHVKK